jgi:hypothetical protein
MFAYEKTLTINNLKQMELESIWFRGVPKKQLSLLLREIKW